MAVNFIQFIQKGKRQRYLILILLIVILVAIFLFGQGFIRKLLLPFLAEKPAPKLEKIEIDFKTLESPILKEMQPFEEIKPFEEEEGRENPFIPYELK